MNIIKSSVWINQVRISKVLWYMVIILDTIYNEWW